MHKINLKLKFIIFCSIFIFTFCNFPEDIPTGPEQIENPNLIDVELAWDVPFTSISSGQTIPIINDEKIYFIDKNFLVCIDLKTGNHIWSNIIENAHLGLKNMILSDNILFVASSRNVQAFDPDTGGQIWATDSALGSTLGILSLNAELSQSENHIWIPLYDKIKRISKSNGESDITIIPKRKDRAFYESFLMRKVVLSQDNFLYTSTISFSGVNPSEIQGTVFGYDAETGENVWEYNIEKLDSQIDLLTIYVGGDIIIDGTNIIAVSKVSMVSLNRMTGELNWQIDYPNDEFGTRTGISLDNNKVFIIGEQGIIYCVDTRTGSELWRINADDGRVSTLSAQNNRLYYCNDSNSGIRIYDQNNGEMLWYDKPVERLVDYSSMMVVKDGIMINIGNKFVYRYNLN